MATIKVWDADTREELGVNLDFLPRKGDFILFQGNSDFLPGVYEIKKIVHLVQLNYIRIWVEWSHLHDNGSDN